MENSLKISKEL